MALGVDLSILNQRGTPAFFSDIFANRPAFGFAGRVFISTDTGAIYEDTGTAWTLIADAGAGTTGTLQQVTTNGNTTTQGISITAGGLSANSITNTSLTTGSVAFVGAAGLMTQDNANFFWDDTNNRLGLGTITPSSKLDIHGAGAMALFNGTGANNGYIGFQNAGATKWTIGNQYTGVVNNFQIINRLGNSVFSITGDEQANFEYNVTIKQALNLNNVGDQLRISSGAIDARIATNSGDNLMFIGATSTSYGINIDLLNNYLIANRFVLSGATSPSGLYYTSNRVTVANYTAAGTVDIEVNGGNSAATFNADLSTTFKGAISATSSSFPLDLYGTTNNYGLRINNVQSSTLFLYSSNANAANRNWGLFTNYNAFGDFTIAQSNAINGDLTNGANSTSRFYISASGNVLIGTTTDTGGKLQVNGAVNATQFAVLNGGVVYLYNDTNANYWYQRVLVANSNNLRFNYNGSDKAEINNATGVYVALSDINVKKDFEQSTIGLNAILGLKPTLYRMKSEDNTEKHLGFIAQEVKEFIPQAYVENEDFIGLSDRPIIAALVKSIQELNEKLVRNNIN